MAEKGNANNSWYELASIIRFRLLSPFRHISFVMYFGCVVVVGGLGVLVTWCTLVFSGRWSDDALRRELLPGIYTFTAALAVTSFVDAQLTELKPKSLRLLLILMTLAVLGLVILTAAMASAQVPLGLSVASVTGTFLGSTLLWWLVNAENPNLHDPVVAPNAPTGGNIEQPLAGNLGGLRHD